MGGIFQVAELDIRFIHSRISFLSEAREATVYWKCIGWNGAESTWKAFDSQILLKFAITLCKTYGGSFDKLLNGDECFPKDLHLPAYNC